MASATEIKQFQLPGNETKYDLIAKNGIFYIEGTGTTAGTWVGTHADISAYYAGLTIAYKIPVAGAATTKLNINNLGAVTVVKNATTAVSTSFPANSVILLVYTLDGTTAYWKAHDYNTNTDTKNTTGSTNKASAKMFIIGATSQAANPQTYSNVNCYIGSDNCLYSNTKKVVTDDQLASITNDDIDAICGAAIYYENEVSV